MNHTREKPKPKEEAIKVLIRVRPIQSRNTAVQISHDHKSIYVDSSGSISNSSSRRQIQCQYDHIFGPKAEQEEVYGHVRYCVHEVLRGYNATIFAYGQTGSGKSHSMFGSVDEGIAEGMGEGAGMGLGRINRDPGIVQRCIRDIFSMQNNNTCSVHVSFLQVYNEQVFDIFDKRMNPLAIHEKDGNIVVPRLMQYRVGGVDQCLALIDLGLQSRAIRETTMNHASSRSHSILQIIIEGNINDPRGGGGIGKCTMQICSKLNLVDLAGSERWGVANGMSMPDEQISEMTNINSSLHTLGRCIAALAAKSSDESLSTSSSSSFKSPSKHKQSYSHIPYRDSKLTRLLQDSLGGNAKTCLVATINPSLACGDESISTLRFADRARQVMTHAKMNQGMGTTKDPEVIMLRNEVNRLKKLLQEHGIVPVGSHPTPDVEQRGNGSVNSSQFEKKYQDQGVASFGDISALYGESELNNHVFNSSLASQEKVLAHQGDSFVEGDGSESNSFGISSEDLEMIASLNEKDSLRKMQSAQAEQSQEEKVETSPEGASQGNSSSLSLDKSVSCQRILGMVRSVLLIVESFTASLLPISVDTEAKPLKGSLKETQCHTPSATQSVSMNVIDNSAKHNYYQPTKEERTNESNLKKIVRRRRSSIPGVGDSKRDPQSALSILLKRRKELRGALEKDSKNRQEVHIKEGFVKAKKSSQEKHQLCPLEKEKGSDPWGGL